MHKENNFDFLRLIFSIFVIITHSYALTGLPEHDWIYQITNGATSFSYLGVRGFFAISGFLIYQSALRSKSIKGYLWRRVLRLYPGLFVALLITVLFLPLVYEASTPFLSHRGVRYYIPNNLTLYNLQYSITGVFDRNPYKGAINGSLWTLAYEFTLYLVFAAFYFLKSKILVRRTLLLGLILVLSLLSFNLLQFKVLNFFISKIHLNSNLFYNLSSFFVVGALISEFKIEQFKHKFLILFGSLLLIALMIYLNRFHEVFFVLWPVIVIIFGSASFAPINKIHKIGDLSYGIYIYAFPVQQFLMYFFNFKVFELMGASLLTTIIFAYFSWTFIESKSMKYKNLIK